MTQPARRARALVAAGCALGALCAPARVFACGGSYEGDGGQGGLFDPALIEDVDDGGFEANAGVADFTEINLDDWDAFFQKRVPRTAWSQLLYKAPLARIDGLIFALQGKRPPTAEDAPFLAYRDRPGLIAALYYVGFAKRVEPFAVADDDQDPWSVKKQRTAAEQEARDRTIAALTEAGGRALAAAKVPFLRQRYALQLLRLRFYGGDDASVLTFFQQHQRREFSGGSSVAWRALGYEAGVLHGAKRYAEANVLYARLFDRYPPMRPSALWSFHPQTEADWDEALRRVTTRHDKLVLWKMLGFTYDALRAMKAIYALDPRSKELPRLMVNAVVSADLEDPPNEPTASPADDRPRELVGFLDKVAARGNVSHPALWSLAAGYLHAMRGETGAAKRWLDRAATDAAVMTDGPLQTQLRVSRFYAVLQTLRSPTASDEAILATELDWLASGPPTSAGFSGPSDLLGRARRRLAALYGKKGDAFTARCLHDDDAAPIEDPAQLDRFVTFLNSPRKTAFQSVVVKMCPYTAQSLTETKGLLFAYRGDFDRAAAILAGVTADTMLGDPFAIRTRDCHSCDAADREAHRGPRYTELQFVARLGALAREAAADPAKAARNYFEIASGLYNLTIYGSSPRLAASPIATDCSRAESYYRRAAEAATDREFRARASFMAAKCELNDWYNQPKRRHDHRWFTILRDRYADTQFYRDMLRECGYFRSFVGARAGGSLVTAPPLMVSRPSDTSSKARWRRGWCCNPRRRGRPGKSRRRTH